MHRPVRVKTIEPILSCLDLELEHPNNQTDFDWGVARLPTAASSAPFTCTMHAIIDGLAKKIHAVLKLALAYLVSKSISFFVEYFLPHNSN